MRALDGFGEHAREVDPASLRRSNSGARLPFVLRQDPGPRNPLGRIKFVMPNKYDIYLHDTPSGHLFAKEDRAFSHGCIRVEKPVELAEYLLRGTQWDRIIRRLWIKGYAGASGTPMPVVILYDRLDGGLSIRFGDDIYGLSGELGACRPSRKAAGPERLA
jgi:murein L,D-transpeptidase YcbB/YkuD